MNQPQLGSFDFIPLSQIRPSGTNPRKHYDAAALDELTNSIREVGVTQPLLLRPWPKGRPMHTRSMTCKYEIVCGERRFRAAVELKLDSVPAIVREMSDDDARQVQMIENLQRADLHPVEEADGYRELVAHGLTVEDVAKKSGKTLGYVQQRLKLLQLEVDAKQLFAEGHLTLGHALLLARLTRVQQERALRWLLNGQNDKTPLGEMIAARVKNLARGYMRGRRLTDHTEAQLNDWIRQNVLLALDSVPWRLDDALLLPIAGACTTCPKRTGANVALFADLTAKEDTCTDPACFAEKQKAITTRLQNEAKEQGTPLLKVSANRSHDKLADAAVVYNAKTKKTEVVGKKAVKEGQWVPAKKGECEFTVKAIAVDGADQGKTKYVCATQSCKKHKHQVQGATRSIQAAAADPLRMAKEAAKVELERAIRAALLKEMRKNAGHTVTILRMVVKEKLDIDNEGAALVCQSRGWHFEDDDENDYKADQNAADVITSQLPRLETADQVALLMFDMLQAAHLNYKDWNPSRRDAWELAKEYKVDADAIAKQVEAAFVPDAPAPVDPKPTKTAKKKSAKPLPGAVVDGKSAGAGERAETAGAR